MKLLFSGIVILLCFSLQPVSAQMAMSFDEAKAQGLDFQKLDSLYTSGIGESPLAVFKGQEDAYVKAYYGMLQDLGNFLNDHDFFWRGQVRCNNRIYFDADGSVDYYFFDFGENLTQSRKNEFKELLGQFIINYKFGMQGEQRFAQCSPVNYRDPI